MENKYSGISHIKLLSTTRYGFDYNNKLEKIDAVLQDIAHVNTKVNVEIMTDNTKDNNTETVMIPTVENVVEVEQEISYDKKIPILYSMQYSNAKDRVLAFNSIINIVNDNNILYSNSENDKSLHGNSLQNVCTKLPNCVHCNSNEVIQNKKITELSAWRQRVMANVRQHNESKKYDMSK